MLKRTFPVYPFLFTIYPVVFLYAHNSGYLDLRELWWPLAISLSAVAMVWAVLAFLLQPITGRAGLVAAFLGIWFFSFGHLLGILQFFHIPYIMLTNTILWVLVLALATYLLLRTRPPSKLVTLLNVIGLLLVGMSSYSITQLEIQRSRLASVHPAEQVEQAGNVDPGKYPDIYYIILDGHARQDVLKDLYGYDNAPFLHFLASRQFHVMKNNHANYAMTALSLTSTLNMRYLDEETKKLGKGSADWNIIERGLKNPEVVRFLKEKGYKTVSIAIPYQEEIASDIVLPMNEGIDAAGMIDPNPPFRTLLNEMTPLRLIKHRPMTITMKIDEPDAETYAFVRLLRLRFFDQLAKAPDIAGPKFVFAHCFLPHPPFLFTADGQPLKQNGPVNWSDAVIGRGGANETLSQYLTGYRGQVKYVDNKIEPLIDNILKKATRPTVVIIQSDHGPAAYFDWRNTALTYPRERMSIFNAFYFSDGRVPEQLHDGTTPVNTFRILLNHYFKTSYPLLEDRSYLSIFTSPYDFLDVTDRLNEPIDKLPKLP